MGLPPDISSQRSRQQVRICLARRSRRLKPSAGEVTNDPIVSHAPSAVNNRGSLIAAGLSTPSALSLPGAMVLFVIGVTRHIMAFAWRWRINVRDAVTEGVNSTVGNPNCDLALPPSQQGQLVSRQAVRNPVASTLSVVHALAVGAPKSVPSSHMRCSTTAILRASATRAFLNPARLASLVPQLFSGLALRARPSMMLAASNR